MFWTGIAGRLVQPRNLDEGWIPVERARATDNRAWRQLQQAETRHVLAPIRRWFNDLGGASEFSMQGNSTRAGSPAMQQPIARITCHTQRWPDAAREIPRDMARAGRATRGRRYATADANRWL